MIEKIKKFGNLPLVIILVVLILLALVLSIVKAQKSEETNANTTVSDTNIQDEKEQEEQEPLITEINVQEVEDETEETPKEEEIVDAKYFIRVNYGQNVVTIYTKDSKGEYTVPYKAMVCSTGTATFRSGTYTIPSGTYSRGTWGMMIGNVWAQYFTRIKDSILFHSVPYFTRDKSDLEYLEYDKLGTAASAGCIRLTVDDAKWIYNNCPAGTKVEFYTDSNPGPLGKPTAQKISEHEEVRGWDPTDPDANNPWKTYTPSQEEETEDNNNNTTTNKKPTTTKPSTPTTPTTPEEPDKGEIQDPTEGEVTDTPDNEGTSGEDTPDEEPGTENEGAGDSGDESEPPTDGENTEPETPTPEEGEGTEPEPEPEIPEESGGETEEDGSQSEGEVS